MGQQGQQGCLGELKKRIDKPPLIDDTSMLLEKYAKMMVGFKGLHVIDGKEMLLKF